MFTISIEVTLPKFEKISIEIECPKCRLKTWVTWGDISVDYYAVCRGCHRNLQLRDHLGTSKRSIDLLKNRLNKLGL